MLLINAVNAEGRPVELYAKDGKIAAVGQGLAALAGEDETVLDAGGLTVLPVSMSSLYSKPGVRQWQCRSTKAGSTVSPPASSTVSSSPASAASP